MDEFDQDEIIQDNDDEDMLVDEPRNQ